MISYPITWIVPVKKNVSKLLTGEYNSIAVRITKFKLIKNLCYLYGKPIISTSANLHTLLPCKTQKEVISQFNYKVFILNGSIGKYKQPSEIRDILTDYIYRKK